MPLLASNTQTSSLLTARNDSFRLVRVIRSSASSYVTYECTPQVKHGSLHLETQPMPIFRPHGSASTSQSDSPAVAPKIVYACVRTPTKQGRAEGQPLPPP